MRPDLVIFDCDGVLVDSETVSNEVLVDNLAGYGLVLSLEQAMSMFVGGTMRGVGEKARQMGAELPKDWVDEIYSQTYVRLELGVDVIKGIPELLDDLDAAGIKFCVASNGSDDKMKITLGQNGLWDRFNGKRFSAHSVGISKPDPGLFLLAAEKAGVSPDACVVIEDSLSGVMAAKRAGMRCFGYAPHGSGDALAEHGAQIFDDMGALADLIDLREMA